MNVLYFIETQSSRLGRWFLECDRDSNSRDAALEAIRNGEAVKVLEVTEPCEDFLRGQVLDITEDLRAECGLPDTYRTPFTAQDAIDWQNDRRRAIQAAE